MKQIVCLVNVFAKYSLFDFISEFNRVAILSVSSEICESKDLPSSNAMSAALRALHCSLLSAGSH